MVLDGNAVRSVDRAAALLLALGDSQGEAGGTELAPRLGLRTSPAARLRAAAPPPRTPQAHGVPPAGGPPAPGPGRAGRGDGQVPARPRRHPARRARRAN